MRAWYFALVRELRPAGAVAHRVQPREPLHASGLVHPQGVRLDAERRQPKAVQGRAAPRGDEHPCRLERAVALEREPHGAVVRLLREFGGDALEDLDAVRAQPVRDEIAGVLGERAEERAAREHGDLRAEARERLRQLGARHASADHHEALRHLPGARRVRGGPDRDVGQAWDLGQRRDRTRGEHDGVPRREREVVAGVVGHPEALGPREPGGAADEGDAGLLRPLDLAGVVPVARGVVPVGQDRRDVECSGDGLACAGDASGRVQRRARAKEGLGGLASPVGARAAEQALLHDGGGEATLDRAVRGVLAGCAAADHYDVILRVHPSMLRERGGTARALGGRGGK
ncbi:hypothetical protein SCMU_07050 [Sinomonas cyclohexanicum]|uniref:Uncharacterized protein n=1 Tax=Sinomonas cyclohexanicum TaxID=322009 RepID=A0ABN6FDS4_SINCY|nr:hypothetical protein SCMU_07050 [Corynebacterium cyclohexanicum]